MKKQTLGIIGGVGPLATMFIGEMIVRRTKATKDQEHLHTIIDNDTNIPDRTAFILDNTKENPVPVIVADAKKLASVGADMIAIPCNTAHTFYDDIVEGSPVPVLHMIRETAKRAYDLGAERVGILATTGTLTSRMYQDALEEFGITPVVPDDTMKEKVMSIIYDYVKAGKDVSKEDWQPIEEAMLALNCDRIVLGCTELSIVNRDLKLSDKYIDSLIVLAERAILACGYDIVG
ncbi:MULTISPECIES: aspartate/glutamate racemase family protein [Lysinibacillus]|uniref:Amino acid racemase n=1 Tax=Lysinibacillus xylanilyticus TaxID=582475 RepID=A0ABV3W432_9BACI|nr:MULTISPECIES: amino acid racemase [Lysinibacillus]